MTLLMNLIRTPLDILIYMRIKYETTKEGMGLTTDMTTTDGCAYHTIRKRSNTRDRAGSFPFDDAFGLWWFSSFLM